MDKKGRVRVVGIARALRTSAAYPVGFGYAMSASLGYVEMWRGAVLVTWDSCCYPRLVKERPTFTVNYLGVDNDDSESENGAIDDVLVSPHSCKWRRTLARMPGKS